MGKKFNTTSHSLPLPFSSLLLLLYPIYLTLSVSLLSPPYPHTHNNYYSDLFFLLGYKGDLYEPQMTLIVDASLSLIVYINPHTEAMEFKVRH